MLLGDYGHRLKVLLAETSDLFQRGDRDQTWLLEAVGSLAALEAEAARLREVLVEQHLSSVRYRVADRN